MERPSDKRQWPEAANNDPQGYAPTRRSSSSSVSLGSESQVDYVTLLVVAVLGVIACTAIVYGSYEMAEKVVLAVVAAMAGFSTRSYLGR